MRIGILYNYVEESGKGRERDRISDNEILDTVRLVQEALASDHEVIPVRASRSLLRNMQTESFDIVFNLCEGFMDMAKGEAYMAGFLELIGLPYTGSDPSALSLCLDKGRVKDVLRANGLPTPRSQLFKDASQTLDGTLRFPLIVKPLMEDASVGIDQDSVVKNEGDLFTRVRHVLSVYRQPALVEEYVDGRELNVAILGNPPDLTILPISEIVFDPQEGRHRIVDYAAKWVEDSPEYGGTKGICPAPLDAEMENHVRRLAAEAYVLLGCRDYARVDFRLGEDGPTILEVNPNPGLNSDSGFVRSAMAMGMGYQEMTGTILQNAIERTAAREGLSQKYAGFHADRIRARFVEPRDIPTLMEWFNDEDISRFMDDPGAAYTTEDLMESFFVRVHGDLDMMIEDAGDNEPIGFLSIYDIDRSRESAEISFLIGVPERRGKGLSSDIARLALRICFEELALNRVSASVTTENVRSSSALKAAGFRSVGVLRECHVVDGSRYDEILMEALGREYRKDRCIPE